jgi:UDP-N-acetylglucosamine diphosphorylase / glucose-1-phosphate thymidylyltransferase / UDP-N-acetylgalactosamine diphosphorylase / glucosamine-1-phosphate N-acetyltransferase / galactosamine-1-phosphate N-acetyltransferase
MLCSDSWGHGIFYVKEDCMKKYLRIEDLLDLDKTIAAGIFEGKEFPWEVLCDIKEFIRKIGSALDPALYEKRDEDIWISRTANVFPSAYIAGPCIIDHGAEIRHCAFIRGSAIVGKNAVVGNSTELKNVILFDSVQVPHYNYVGDSVLGYKAHMGAGAITSNVKADRKPTVLSLGEDGAIETGLKKFGAILGDYAEIGCNTVLNPATVIGRNTNVYPLSFVRGYVPANSIFKKAGSVVTKKNED